MRRPWTIYPARPLTGLPPDVEEVLGREFEMLKHALRGLGFKLFEFVGLDPSATCEQVNDFDLTCVELADLLLAIRPCAADGVASEIAWKCARKEHVIVCVPKGCTVSRLTKGWKARNPNFRYVEYTNILDLVPLVMAHFSERTDFPRVFAPGLEQFPDPVTRQPLFRQKKMPVAT
jgi:hypothetical protein